MYLWWSLCTLYLRACQVSYRWRHGLLLLCLCLWRLSSSNELPCVLIQISCVYGRRIKILILVSAGAWMELRLIGGSRALLTQVSLTAAAKDLFSRLSFQCRLSDCLNHTALRVQLPALTIITTACTKSAKHWQPYHCLDT